MVGGMSLTQAANHYNINVTTLKDHADAFASNGTVARKKRGPKKKIHFTDNMYRHVSHQKKCVVDLGGLQVNPRSVD